MFNRMKLGAKFTLVLLLVFIGGIGISGYALSEVLIHKSEEYIADKGLVLMQTMNSVREYTNTHVSPLLAPDTKNQEKFRPETIPSFSVREVFENFRKTIEYKNFLYKDAALNPTNMRDKADQFESKIIEQFRKNLGVQQISGYRSFMRQQSMYSARPITITKQSCLACHSTVDIAPKNMLNTYGSKHGFGWKLNQIIGTQIIYVPATDVFESARRSFSLVMGIFVGIFAVVIILINFLLKRTVIQRIEPMAKLAQKLSSDEISSDEDKEFESVGLAKIAMRSDELGQLGRIFQRMVREVKAREQSLKKQVMELRIEIDHAKREREVAEIVESDYFQNLLEKAKEVRSKKEESDP